MTNVLQNPLFQRALEEVQRASAPQTKVSSSPPKPPVSPDTVEQVKLSQIKERNLDLMRVGRYLEAIGTKGLEKVAMDQSNEGDQLYADPVPLSQVDVSSGEAPSDPSKAIVDSTPTPGPTPTMDQGNLATAEGAPSHPDGQGQVAPSVDITPKPPVDTVADGGKAATSSTREAARYFSKIASLELFDASQRTEAVRWAAKHMDVHGPLDAMAVFRKSAQVRGLTLDEFVRRMKLSDPNRRQSFRNQVKVSSINADSEIAQAKDAVESLVKSRGELPTTGVVAQAANVSPAAANAAIYETAELIAAVGGQVAAPGQAAAPMAPASPMMANMTGMPMGGAPPIPGAPPMIPPGPMGASQGMPMMPPGGAPMPPGGAPMPPGGAPMPPGGAPMPPQDPGMQVQASQGARKEQISHNLENLHPLRLRESIHRVSNAFRKISEGMSEGMNGPLPHQNVVEGLLDDPLAEIPTSALMTPGDRAMMDAVLDVPDAPQSAVEHVTRQPTGLKTPLTAPAHKGPLTDNVEVTGLYEGDLPMPSGITANTPPQNTFTEGGKSSRSKVSEDLGTFFPALARANQEAARRVVDNLFKVSEDGQEEGSEDDPDDDMPMVDEEGAEEGEEGGEGGEDGEEGEDKTSASYDSPEFRRMTDPTRTFQMPPMPKSTAPTAKQRALRASKTTVRGTTGKGTTGKA